MASFALSTQAQDCCKGSIEIKGEEFAEKDGNVYIKFSIVVNGNEIDSKASIRLTPEITGVNNKLKLPSVLINGKTRKRMNDRWIALANKEEKLKYSAPKIEYTAKKKTIETIKYELTVPYEKWMSSSNLTINQKVTGCAQSEKLFNSKLYSNLLIESREQYTPHLSISYTSPEKEKIKKRDFQGRAYIDFPVGSSIILADFRNNPSEIAKINADISRIKDNTDLELASLVLTGYASPEGSYSNNERLSSNRTLSLKKYLENIFNYPSQLLKTNSIAEDWDGFREAILNGNASYKKDVLAIIDSRDAYDKKEQRLKSLLNGGPYKEILRDIFPSLRRVEYQIEYVVKDFDLDESKLIYSKEAKNLSELELYNLARTYTKGSKNYLYIMTELIPQNFPNSATASENAFAALIESNEFEKAKAFLDKLSDDNIQNINNKAIYHLKTGDIDTAKSLFRDAQSRGSKEAIYNLNEIEKSER